MAGFYDSSNPDLELPVPSLEGPSKADEILFSDGSDLGGDLPPMIPGDLPAEPAPTRSAALDPVVEIPTNREPVVDVGGARAGQSGEEFRTWESIAASRDFIDAPDEEKRGAAELWGNYATDYLRRNSADDAEFAENNRHLAAYIKSIKEGVAPISKPYSPIAPGENNWGAGERKEASGVPEFFSAAVVKPGEQTPVQPVEKPSDLGDTIEKATWALEDQFAGNVGGAVAGVLDFLRPFGRAFGVIPDREMSPQDQAKAADFDARIEEARKNAAKLVGTAGNNAPDRFTNPENFHYWAKQIEDLSREKEAFTDTPRSQTTAGKIAETSVAMRKSAAEVPGTLAGVMRGYADVMAILNTAAVGGTPGAITGIAADASTQAGEAVVEQLKAAGIKDEKVIEQARTDAGAMAAVRTIPAAALFWGSGKLASKAAGALLPEEASAIAKALAGGSAALVSNIGTSAVLRYLEAPEGKEWEAAKPTVQSLTVDTLFAIIHGVGEYSGASPTARARAEAEVKTRAPYKEFKKQLEDPALDMVFDEASQSWKMPDGTPFKTPAEIVTTPATAKPLAIQAPQPQTQPTGVSQIPRGTENAAVTPEVIIPEPPKEAAQAAADPVTPQPEAPAAAPQAERVRKPGVFLPVEQPKAAVPKLRAGQQQGDLLAGTTEDAFNLAGETAIDGERVAREKADAEAAQAAARADFEKRQMELTDEFGAPKQPEPEPAPEPAPSAEAFKGNVGGDFAPTVNETKFAAELDKRRTMLEGIAQRMGGRDPELSAATAITDVLALYDPAKPMEGAALDAALKNRVRQVVANEYRAEQTEKRGGAVEKQSMDADPAAASKIEDAKAAAPDAEASRGEMMTAIAESVNGMDAQTREIVFGIQEGRSLAEIAEDLGLSKSAAQRRWAAAQEKLRETVLKGGWRNDELGAILNPFYNGKGGTGSRPAQPTPISTGSLLVTPYAMPSLRRKAAQLWLGKNGAFPPEMASALEAGGRREAANKWQFSMLAKDVTDALNEVGPTGSTARTAQETILAEFLETNTSSLFRLATPRLQEAARRARIALDDVSGALVREGAVPTGLANVIVGNMGGWLRRYYRAFDPDANWNLDSLMARAASRGTVTGPAAAAAVDAGRILADARSYIQADLQRRGLPRTPDVVEAIMRTLTDRQQMETWMQGGGVSADVGSFMARRVIAPEIRALMGEETNPVLRIERSGSFLAQAITRHRTQRELRTAGLLAGAFWPAQRGRFSVAVPAPNPGRSPWRGLYTTPEFAAAMSEARLYGEDNSTATGMIEKLWRRIVGETKFNLVAANPRSTVVNALGGLFQTLSNGAFFVPATRLRRYARDSFASVFRGDGSIDATGANAAIQQRVRNLHAEMIAAGVLDNSISVRDFESTVADKLHLDVLDRDAVMLDRAKGAARGAVTGYAGTLAATGSRTAAAAGAAVGATAGAAVGSDSITKFQRALGKAIIGNPDSFWKVWNWLDNYATQVVAGTPLAESATIATERTRQTMPTYDEIPEGLRRVMKYIPGANVFFQFTWELYRNNYHNARIAISDLQSPNPVLRKSGAKRLIGLASLVGAGAGTIASMWAVSNWSKERDRAFRRSFAPEWDRNAVIAPTKIDGSKISYVNGKYLIPQMTFAEIMQAAKDGDGPEGAFGNVISAITDDFAKSNAAVDPVIEAMMNRKSQTGKPVSTEPGLTGKLERLEHYLKKAMSPGVAQEIGKLRMAATGEQSGYGRTYSFSERAAGIMGLRENTYDIKQQLAFRLADIDRGYSEIKKQQRTETAKVSAMKNSADLIAEIDARAERLRMEAKAKIVRLFSDARELGITERELSVAQSDRKIGLPNELRLAWLAERMRAAGLHEGITPESVETALGKKKK